MRFKNKITILHGTEKKLSSRKLAFIIANNLAGCLPKELDAGSSVKVDIDFEFYVPDTLTRLT